MKVCIPPRWWEIRHMEAAAERNEHGTHPGTEIPFRELVETCPCALLAFVDGRIAYANPAASALLGAPAPKSIVGRHVSEFVHESSRPTFEPLMRGPALQLGESERWRGLWLRLDGSPVEVEVQMSPWAGHPAAGQMYLRPLQERRELEDSLRDAEQRIRTVTEQVQDFAIFSVDPLGRVASWNPGAERVFGYRPEEVIGRPFDIIFVPEDRAKNAPQSELQQASKTGVAQDERWHLRADGRRIFVSGLLVSVLDDAGRVAMYTKVTQDRTQQRQAQDALQASETRYRQLAAELETRVALRTQHLQQSVQTWESFCYSIAHDLRAPLRTISGFADALLEDYAPALDDTAKDYARRMVAAAERLDDFIHDLLSFGRLAHADLPVLPVPLENAIDNALAGLAEEISSAGAVVEVSRPLPVVMANVAALNQVLSNLLTNALKFVKPGETARVEITANEISDVIRVSVRDHGIGIESEHHDRVFQLFERLHPSSAYPGTGVGLAIVRKAMERMGGAVGLESTPGNGASFWIELRRAQPPG